MSLKFSKPPAVCGKVLSDEKQLLSDVYCGVYPRHRQTNTQQTDTTGRSMVVTDHCKYVWRDLYVHCHSRDWFDTNHNL